MKSYKAAFGAGLASLVLTFGLSATVAMAAPKKDAPKDSKGHFEKSVQVAAFWNWFSGHQAELSAMKGPDAPIFGELTKQIKTIDKDLVFEIEQRKDGKKEFAISANCNLRLFPLVENTVALAPTVKDWQIVAFRRRVPAEMLKGLSISAQPAFNGKIIAGAPPIGVAVKDMRYKLSPSGNSAKLNIFIKNYKADGPQSHMAEMMLQQAIGEYDSVKKISEIKCEPDTVPAAKDAKPFAELPAALDKIAPK